MPAESKTRLFRVAAIYEYGVHFIEYIVCLDWKLAKKEETFPGMLLAEAEEEKIKPREPNLVLTSNVFSTFFLGLL